MNSLHTDTYEDIRNLPLKPHLIWTHVRQTRVCETNAYVSMQGLANDNLMYPPILYVLMNGNVVFFWEREFPMSRLGHF